MLRVKLIGRMAGPDGNYPPGAVISVSDSAAKQLTAGGYAVYIDQPHGVVKAVKPQKSQKTAPAPKAKPRSAAKKAVK